MSQDPSVKPLVDIDKVILSFCFQNKACLAKVSSIVDGVYFASDYRKFGSAVIDYYKKYKKIITWNIIEHTLNEKKAPTEKILYYQKLIDTVTTNVCNENEFDFYFDEFKKRYWTQLLKDTLICKDKKNTGAVDLLIEQKPLAAWERIKKAGLVIEMAKQSDEIKRGDIKGSANERLEKYLHNKQNPQEAYGLLTGFKHLDQATKGLRGGEVLVIAGRPGAGKSQTALAMGKNIYKAGKNILFISIEMPKEQYELRFDACYSKLEADKIELGKLSEAEEDHYKKCLEEMKARENTFYIIDTVNCTPMMVEAELEYVIESGHNGKPFRPDIVVIDYLGIMKPDERQKSDNEEQAQIIMGIRNIARRYKIPFIVPVQMNRDLGKHRKGTERISRSDAIPQTADVCIQIEEKDEHDEAAKLSNEIVYYFVKNRKGKSNEPFSMYYNPASMTIEDRDYGKISEDFQELE